jgi:F0F1-type ATP synthase assembly protein I
MVRRTERPVEEGKRMLAAKLFLIVFLLLHIVAGVLWV